MSWMPLMGTGIAIRMVFLSAEQAQKNHGQSLQLLAQRGGLAPSEALALMECRAWQPSKEKEALRGIVSAIDRLNASRTEYGWLVENGKQGEELRYRTWRDGYSAWTADRMEATRYCRRIDAERAHQEDEDAWLIVQHAWDDSAQDLCRRAMAEIAAARDE